MFVFLIVCFFDVVRTPPPTHTFLGRDSLQSQYWHAPVYTFKLFGYQFQHGRKAQGWAGVCYIV